jgi:hypothetical protein
LQTGKHAQSPTPTSGSPLVALTPLSFQGNFTAAASKLEGGYSFSAQQR